MSRFDIFKKQAKQLVRWHREGNHSIGGRIRGLARYKALTDREALAHAFPLREAQEIIALEAGHASWAALKVAVTHEPTSDEPTSDKPTSDKPKSPALRLTCAVPVLLVANVQSSAEFFRDTLGFSVDFLHGQPPFYGAVSRDGASVHLKFVHEPVLAPRAPDQDGFITAFIRVENVKALYAEYIAAGATFDQKLKKQAWGGRDFIVRGPDGNGICFVDTPKSQARPDATVDGGSREP
jgi:catechol 2,3-dioxygenase-like lactoylglutathione lyase family enzyme